MKIIPEVVHLKKETLAEKIAKAEYSRPEFQKSWAVHMQVFGPILEPAFVGDYESRVHLCAALNKISSKDTAGGIQTLNKIKHACVTDADHAAWLFFMGLCHELSRDREQMLRYYRQAGEFHHRYCLPYLKIARYAYEAASYEEAVEYYRIGISCFDDKDESMEKKTVLAASYGNLGANLMMMHRFDEARAALQKSSEILPDQPGCLATEALLYAALGNETAVHAHLSRLALTAPSMIAYVKSTSGQILRGENPHFSVVEIDTNEIDLFWRWFDKHQEPLKQALAAKQNTHVAAALQEQLRVTFCFLERIPEIKAAHTETGCRITLSDNYTISLTHGYSMLIDACPEPLRAYWTFEIVHYPAKSNTDQAHSLIKQTIDPGISELGGKSASLFQS